MANKPEPIPTGKYGERKTQQAIADAPTGQATSSPGPAPTSPPDGAQVAPGASSAPAGPVALPNAFGPTERLEEPVTTLPDVDIEEMTRARLLALYTETRSPWLLPFLLTD